MGLKKEQGFLQLEIQEQIYLVQYLKDLKKFIVRQKFRKQMVGED